MIAKAIVGLGNPGEKFIRTRHNAGYNVVELLAARYGGRFTPDPNLFAEVCKLEAESGDILLVKPMTGMNDSGRTVAALVEEHKLDLSSLMVVYDDVSMPLGRLRFQHGGSAGGHHGIESTIAALNGAREFNRLKVAVGPDPGGAARLNFVLSPITGEQFSLYLGVVEVATAGLECWLSRGIDAAMSAFNGLHV